MPAFQATSGTARRCRPDRGDRRHSSRAASARRRLERALCWNKIGLGYALTGHRGDSRTAVPGFAQRNHRRECADTTWPTGPRHPSGRAGSRSERQQRLLASAGAGPASGRSDHYRVLPACPWRPGLDRVAYHSHVSGFLTRRRSRPEPGGASVRLVAARSSQDFPADPFDIGPTDVFSFRVGQAGGLPEHGREDGF